MLKILQSVVQIQRLTTKWQANPRAEINSETSKRLHLDTNFEKHPYKRRGALRSVGICQAQPRTVARRVLGGGVSGRGEREWAEHVAAPPPKAGPALPMLSEIPQVGQSLTCRNLEI